MTRLLILVKGELFFCPGDGRPKRSVNVPGTILSGLRDDPFGAGDFRAESYVCVLELFYRDLRLPDSLDEEETQKLIEQIRLISIIADKSIADLADKSALYEDRMNLEQLLMLLISFLTVDESESIDNRITKCLEMLANYFVADEVGVYLCDHSVGSMRKEASWASADFAIRSTMPDEITPELVPWAWDQLADREAIIFGDLRALPEEAEAFRTSLRSKGVQSVSYTPLRQKPSIGFLAMHACGAERPWSQNSATLLSAIGELVAKELARKEIDATLERILEYDPLTGLGNAVLLRKRLSQIQACAQTSGTGYAILYIDVDRFQRINDSLGYTSGDAAIAAVVKRLSSAVRVGDTLSRLGGDEFVLIAADVSTDEAASALARSLEATLRDPIFIDGHEIDASVSIGVAVHSGSTDDVSDLVTFANSAMLEAKRNGRKTIRFHVKTADKRHSRLSLEAELKKAIIDGELELHCQPKVMTTCRALAGAEALVRWRHKVNGLMRPDLFLPLAEESGLIIPMSDWVLREACRQRLTWPDFPGEAPRIAVNVSGRWLNDPSFLNTVSNALREFHFPPCWLELEVTEESILGNMQFATSSIKALREQGISIALDDFGTGYSSLSYLRLLPVDTLKIDKSFITRIGEDRVDALVVDGIIRLAHNLDLVVVAEGIETSQQNEILSNFGCDITQGYLTGRPMQFDIFQTWLADERGSLLI